MIKQVTSVSSSASTIVTPSPRTKFLIIQNNGSGNVRLSVDGGSTYTNPYSNAVGTDPTASTGYRLSAGAQLVLTLNAEAGNQVPIRAILETATTTTLDIVTNDVKAS
jgi:hypothetical protein